MGDQQKTEFLVPRLIATKRVLDMVRKIVYAYVWDGRKGISWRQMAKTKQDGGIGLCGIRTMVVVMGIKQTIRIWTYQESIGQFGGGNGM